MLEIGAGLLQRCDGIELRGGAAAETGELRENEPHPVALLRACAELGESGLEAALLGVDEALKIVGIGHAGIMRRRGGGKSSPRLLMRRQQPRQNIEQDHHRPGEQGGATKPRRTIVGSTPV